MDINLINLYNFNQNDVSEYSTIIANVTVRSVDYLFFTITKCIKII